MYHTCSMEIIIVKAAGVTCSHASNFMCIALLLFLSNSFSLMSLRFLLHLSPVYRQFFPWSNSQWQYHRCQNRYSVLDF
ncbi:hypothetical protein PHAVU_005G186000 [Phaseolus vulgaris]|uniref:Uncharacterized protein n=1 Tax=Phaseolus vulgaris TaxID=3885 RepID=V7C0F4_PHAVU|nr:hypothetical protein PHAVU_005G186000g [Phaseolus vulgaris]ESW22843.1 hypothetical protein PHAVU_005G186000g [Phaseolus vulgaris]